MSSALQSFEKVLRVGEGRRLKRLGAQAEYITSLERNPSIRDCHVAEGTIFTKGHSLRARESSGDMRRSIDGLADKLLRGVTKYREKRRREPRRKAERNTA